MSEQDAGVVGKMLAFSALIIAITFGAAALVWALTPLIIGGN